MKKYLLSFIAFCTGTLMLSAQPLTGSLTIKPAGGTYASLAAAIADLNTNGVGTGGVTFVIDDGYTETFTSPTAGTITTVTGSATNPIVFQKSGTGTNPVITAAVGTTTTTDGIIKIAGCDFITFDGIDLQESSANTTSTTQMEWGYAIVKASASDGSQNITIKNCKISLNKANTASVGIYGGNHIATSTTALTIATSAGTNSNIKIFNNDISNVYSGISITGSSVVAYYDINNQIGVQGGNMIRNFGGSTVATYGIYTIYQNNLSISNNDIGGGKGSTSTSYGIMVSTATNASITVYNNTVSDTTSTTTSSTYGIALSNAGVTGTNNTVIVRKNTVRGMASVGAITSGALYGYYIYYTVSMNLYIDSNNFINNKWGNTASSSTGTIYGFYIYPYTTSPTAGSIEYITDNYISGTNRKQSAVSTGTYYGMYIYYGQQTTNTYNNVIEYDTLPTTSTNYSMYVYNYYATTVTYKGNIVRNIFKPIGSTGTYYGIYISNAAYTGTFNYFNNSINNINTGTSAATIYGQYNASTAVTKNMYENTVYNIQALSSGAVYGLYQSGGTTVNFYKNSTYNLSSSSGIVYGIYLSSGTTVYAYNNYVSQLYAPTSASNPAIYAAYIAGGTTMGLYYNTLFLNATSTSSTFGTSALYVSTTPSFDLRNNIIINTSTPGATGRVVAYQRSTTTTTTFNTLSNRNCYYVGATSPTRGYFWDGTNLDTSLIAYQTRITPAEQGSVKELPPFVNTTTTPYDLHLLTTIPTECESWATPITSPISITTDFDGNTRNSTSPDIGADEGAFLLLDASAPNIQYSNLNNTLSTNSRTLKVKIADAKSGVPRNGSGMPVLYWKKNFITSWTSSSPTYLGNDSFSYGLGTGVAPGDTVYYYIVAQDSQTTPKVGSYPSGASGFSANPPVASNPPANPSFYVIISNLSGTYKIGGSGNTPSPGCSYVDLTAAMNKLKSSNLTGPVNFVLTSTYSTIQEDALPIVILPTLGSSSTNSITIKPDSGTTIIVGGSSTTSIIKIEGADNIIFDGSNNASNSRDLTIMNTATTASSAVIWASSSGANMGCKNDIIKNCNLMSGIGTTSATFGIFLGGTTIGTSYPGSDNDSFTIQNNSIKKAYFGIWASGNSGYANDLLTISGNSIGAPTGSTTDYIGYSGIYLAHATNSTITQNTVFNIIGTITTPVGISINTGVLNSSFTRNNINNIVYTGTGGYGGRGIFVNTGSTTSNLTFSNNVVAVIGGDGYTNFSGSSPVGMYFDGTTGGLNIYHNSVYLSGTVTRSAATITTAVLFNTTAMTNIDLRDNIFMNALNNTVNTSAKNYAIYTTTTPTTFWNMDYNDYYVSGSQGVLGYVSGADRTTLAAWKSATGKDANSISVDPSFSSTTYLVPLNSSALNLGTALTSVPIDFNGTTRNNPPEMGAYEVNNMSYVSSTTTQTTGKLGVNTINQNVIGIQLMTAGDLSPLTVSKFTVNANGSSVLHLNSNISNAKLFYTGTSNTFSVTGGALDTVATPTISAFSINLNTPLSLANGTNYFWLTFDIKSSAYGLDTVDAECTEIFASDQVNAHVPTITNPLGNRIIKAPLSGIYTINNTAPTAGTNYNNFLDAFNDLNTLGISGPVTFNVYATQTFNHNSVNFGTWGEALRLYATGTVSNPIVFQKYGTGNDPVINIIGTLSTLDIGIWISGGDYITFDGIKVLDLGSSSFDWLERGIYLQGTDASNGCRNNTIKNCTVDLSKNNTNAYGIMCNSGFTTPTINGTNDNNKFYNNTVKDCYNGYYFIGTAQFRDRGNEVGTSLVDTITANGIYANYQNNLKIFNNTIRRIFGTVAINASYFASSDNLLIDNNTFQYFNNTTTLYGIYLTSSNYPIIQNNRLSNITSTGTLAGTYLTNCDFPVIHHNNINNLTTTGTLYGSYISSSDNVNYYNNNLDNLNAGSTLYGVYATSCNGINHIYSNRIDTLTNTGGNTIALYPTSGANNFFNIYKNTINNVNYTGVGSLYVYGLYANGATTTYNIFNNYIFNLRAPGSIYTTTPSVLGVYANGNVSLNYNTIYLNYTSTSATNKSSALHASVTYPLLFKNNILVNTSDMTIGAGAYAFSYASTSYTNINTACNYNLLYAGTPSSKNLIFNDATNSDQTLADYKTRITPREQQSVTENPPFISSVSPYNLHINTSTATRLESGGNAVTGIDDDYDGNVRKGSTGYSGSGKFPDIGADEFNGVLLDAVPPSITYTPLVSTSSISSRSIIATIIDQSGVPDTGIGLPMLYWKKNSGGTWTGSQANYISNSNYSFSFGSGVTTGDTVFYYFVAQDSMSTANLGASPSAGATGFSANPPSITTAPLTPNSYIILPSFAGGNYYIGGTGSTPCVTCNYVDITDAFAALNNKEISAAVNFILTSDYHSVEEAGFPIIINPVLGASASKIVTIKPDAGITDSIIGSSTTSIIKLNGADYVTIDGSNNGTSSRNLSIINTSTAASTAAIWAASQGNGAGCKKNTIKNCIIAAGINTTAATFGIFLGGNTIGVTLSGSDNDSFTIQNNEIKRAYFGISAYGNLGYANDVLNITGNSIGAPLASPTDYIWYVGIDLAQTVNSNISQNTIYNIIANTADVNGPMGLRVNAGVVNSSFTRNNINNINSIATATSNGWGGRGMYFNTGNPASNLTIANNSISRVTGDGYHLFYTSSPVGLYFEGITGGLKIYNNSIYMSDTLYYPATTDPSTKSTAVLFNTSTITDIDMRNNIFMNSMRNTVNLTATNYAIYSNTPASGFTNIDYNDYYVSGTQGVLGYIAGADITSLAVWKTATGKDAHSLNFAPVFVSNTDLHLKIDSNNILNAAATPISGITVDIDGDTRNTTTPDIGSDEFTPTTLPSDAGIIALITPTSISCEGLQQVRAVIKNFGPDTLKTATINWSVNNVAQTPKSWTGNLLSLGKDTVIIGSYTFIGSTTPNIIVRSSLPNGSPDGVLSNDTFKTTLQINPRPVSGFTINNNSQCLNGNSFAFTNTTTGASTNFWNFGDATATTTTTSPTHSYTAAGGYSVKLVSTNTYGCKDSITKSLNVRPHPVSAFTPSATSLCLSGNNFAFTNSTSISSGTFNSLWQFGDNATSATTSPSHSYSTAGTYAVKLIATSDYSCKDSITKNVTVNSCLGDACVNSTGNKYTVNSGNTNYKWSVMSGGTITGGGTTTDTFATVSWTSSGTHIVKVVYTKPSTLKDSTLFSVNVRPQPVSSFTINNNSQCLSANNFIFTNTTTGASTYLWKFGDANTSASTSPSHGYTSAGSYSVKLISTTTYGCKDSTTKTLDVRPQPVAGFSINNNSQCLSGNSFAFTNTASGASTALWNFGDATATTTVTSPSHTYTSAGSYTVKLVSTTTYGCKDSTTKTLDVRPQPTATFTINNNSQCLSGNYFAFTNTATGASTALWNFGDATATTTITSPSHTYTSAGSFTVKLVSTTSYGCKDSTTKTLDVRPQPVAGFSINNNSQCLSGNNFAFTNTATGASTALWNFGDATATTTVTSPSHTYTSAGTFTVKLVSTTTYGCKDSTTKTLDVRPQPTAGFTINNNSQCLSGNSFVFTNTASGASTALWNFGDATATTTVTSPSHSYTIVGTFTVKLVSTTTYGCKDSTTKTLDLRPQPTAGFTINNNSQCLSGNSFVFTNTASGASTTLWNFGDATATTTVTSPSHTYTSAGTFTVKLVSTTTYGCKDSTTKTLDVRPQPTAGFTINNNSQCLSGNSFVFTNTASGASTALWNFGDATATTTVTSPSHTYTAAGAYTVKLVSTTTYGCKDSTTKTLDVRPQPVSSFTINNNSQCLSGNNFAFTNTATGASTALWNFGDATATSTTISPSHTYTTADSFIVKLVSETTYGCKDSATNKLYVWPQPVSSYTISNNSQCLSANNFAFTNTATGASTYLWNFGDATATTTITSPSHTYTTADSFIVKLVSTTTYGCKDSNTTKLYVRPHPVTAFAINDTTQCFSKNLFTFTNNSTISSGSFTSNWDFGDTTYSTTSSPTNSYLKSGNYVVKLVTTSDFGCKDSTTDMTYVDPSPSAIFVLNADKQCFGSNLFAFSNNSTISAGSINAYWNFGDGDTTTTFSPSHTYLSADTFQVSLLITSDRFCADSIKGTVVVFPQPKAGILLSDTGLCLKANSFTFTDNSTVSKDTIAVYIWNFGDGNSDTVKNSIHSYATDGNFNLKHIVRTSNGCKDSITKIVSVYPQPKASFTVNDTNQCMNGNLFDFKNTSTISSGNVSYHWDLGDGTTSSDTNKKHSYALVKQYQVWLKVSSLMNCSDSIMHLMHLKANPVVNLGADDTIYGSESIILKADTGFDAYLWSNTSTANQITVDSTTYGLGIKTFWVKVTENGCDGFDTVLITIIKANSIDDPQTNFELKVYPNPVRSILTMELSPVRKEIVITLTDMNGKQLKSIRIMPNNLSSVHQLDVSELVKGVYYLNISNSGIRKVTKIVKY